MLMTLKYMVSAHRIELGSTGMSYSVYQRRGHVDAVELPPVERAKTKVLWCASGYPHDQLPDVSFTVSCDTVKPVRCVHDLGIYLDSDVSMRTHVSNTIASCFAALLHRVNQKHTTSSEQTIAVVTSYVTDPVKTGLWQCLH